jgi:UDP-glucose 4-epimerase
MSEHDKWLVTGGAGYIGSHIADVLLSAGKEVVIYDSMYHGLETRVDYLRKKHNKEVPLVVSDIRNFEAFKKTLESDLFQGIIHTAALKSVAESIEKPADYFEVNLYATKRILEIASLLNVHHFVFSSTAAVYGTSQRGYPIREDDIKNPMSPYGDSKRAAEIEVAKFHGIPGNYGTSLRFFNVVGTSAIELVDNSIENLVPIVIRKLMKNVTPAIFGIDYSTPDGTCIRDYVDVRDIATAHLAVCNSDFKLPFAMNVGTGRGISVREAIQVIHKSFGEELLHFKEEGRRKGDPESLFADASLIQKTLGFSSEYTFESSIMSLTGRSGN